MSLRLSTIVEWFGRVGLAFVLLFGAWLALGWLAPASGFRILLEIGWLIAGAWLAIRMVRRGSQQAVWRLRHRLLVTYLFIAVMPFLWIVALGALGAYSLIFQIAINVVTSALDERVAELESAAETVARANPGTREAAMTRVLEPYFTERYAGLEAVLRQAGRETRFPAGATAPAPPDESLPAQGILHRDGRFYLWSHVITGDGDVTITAPVTRALLDGLAPGLGPVDAAADPSQIRTASSGAAEVAQGTLPPKANLFDLALPVYTTLPASEWDTPGEEGSGFTINLLTLPSAVLRQMFSRQAASGLIELAFVAGLVVFLAVVIVCWVIGITITRTITSAVHHLDEGTRRVMQGDFSHRIQVTGGDQLAQLSHSFNRMTENLEDLLKVAKEKERLQAEIEIAREVQNLLYPRSLPQSKTLRLAAVCHPARMVSGDYYDYEVLGGEQIAVAIGDVAGKGVSAALLMATLQSALRTHLQSSQTLAAGAANGSARVQLSTSSLVSTLNQHLCANTATEKYATFCLGIYDEAASSFVYTNAGHLPPALLRRGEVQRLDVNGTVVGAFPFAGYEESRVVLEAGDLLVCFTDGITEPENAFGEMFGEERFIDLVMRHVDQEESRIIGIVLDAVREWTGSDELQDDMTLLLARRV